MEDQQQHPDSLHSMREILQAGAGSVMGAEDLDHRAAANTLGELDREIEELQRELEILQTSEHASDPETVAAIQDTERSLARALGDRYKNFGV